jgi:hypothetical protein
MHKGGVAMNAKKVIYMLLILFVLVLAGTIAWDIDRYIQTQQYKDVIKQIHHSIVSNNETTQNIEDMWDKIEKSDTSAVRAQLYEMRSIRARLSNIDSTVEDLISLNIVLLNLHTQILRVNIYILLSAVSLLVVYILGSLLLR